jgi:hypothetical protein
MTKTWSATGDIVISQGGPNVNIVKFSGTGGLSIPLEFINPYYYTPRKTVTSIKIDPTTQWASYTYNNSYVAGTRTIYRLAHLPNAPDSEIEYDYVSKKWYDKGYLEPTVVNQVDGYVTLTATVSGVTLIRAKFFDPYFFHPTPVQTINFDSGTTWGDDLPTPRNYKYIYTDGDIFVYSLIVNTFSTTGFEIQYDYITKKWEDRGIQAPIYVDPINGYVKLKNNPNDGQDGVKFLGAFSDPYYYIPNIVQTITLNKYTQWGDIIPPYYYNYYTTQGSKYVYSLIAPIGTSDYEIQYDYMTKTWSARDKIVIQDVHANASLVRFTSTGSSQSIPGEFVNPYYYTPRTTITSIKIDPTTQWGVLNYTYNNSYVSGTRTIYRLAHLSNAPDSEIEYDYVSKKWYDKGHLEPTVVNQVGGDVTLTATVSGATQIRAKFVDPYLQPTIVGVISFDVGTFWADLPTPQTYNHFSTEGSKFVYRLNSFPSSSEFEIQYDYVTKTWSDKGSSFPHTINKIRNYIILTSSGYDGTNGTKILGAFPDPYHDVTKFYNLALRATFEDSNVYINPDTLVSNTMTVGNNSFEITTSKSIQGTKSGVKSSISRNFRISNFITGPYTITFWVFSPIESPSWIEQFKTILSPDRFIGSINTWSFNISPASFIGVNISTSSGFQFFSTGISYANVYNRWVMMSISSSGRVTIKGTNTTDYDGLLFSGTYNTAGDSFEFGGDESNLYDITTVIYFDDIRVYNTELTSRELNDVYIEFIQPSNLVLRATFEDTTVYINPDTNVRGAMTVSQNNFDITIYKRIQGIKSGYKSNTSKKFIISNFITGSYTITFWVFSPFTGTWGGLYKRILVTDSFNLSFNSFDGVIGLTNSNEVFDSTTISYSNIYNRWVMMSISSSGMVTIKGTNTTDYDGIFLNQIDDITGDTLEFGGETFDDDYAAVGMYFDDIRVYNVVLTSSQLNDVYNENSQNQYYDEF